MSDKVYDTLKIIALIVLPAITTFVGTTLTALNFEYTEVVVVIKIGRASCRERV